MTKVFSGIRSSGRLHLGNYLGAIKNWVALQDEAEQCIFAVVDLHGVTTPYDPEGYAQQVMDTALDFLAAGVDPNKALLIRQSRIPQHTELMWLLATITPVGWLERLPNWREKVDQVQAMGERGASYRNNLSLLSYPVLMAADILLYKSDLVPVSLPTSTICSQRPFRSSSAMSHRAHASCR
jgi:tryptophanyl-tRNA synthetase